MHAKWAPCAWGCVRILQPSGLRTAWLFRRMHVQTKMEGCERLAGPQLAGPVPAAGAELRQLNMALSELRQAITT